MKTVFLDMPLESIHKLAFKAAVAARCAGEQEKFWPMHDRLFESQKALEPWTAHAEAVSLDRTKFEECLGSERHDAEIRRDMAEARKVGVTGTPAFFLGRTDPNGSKVKVLAALRGAKAFADFKTELDRLLEEAAKPQAEGPPAGADSPERPEEDAKAAEAPAPKSFAPDGKLDDITRASLDRVLATAPEGSPAWIAAPQSDPRALALADELAAAFNRAGWRVRPVRRTALAFRSGTYVFAGDVEPPSYVRTVARALDEAGFAANFRTGYRAFYEEKKKADPKFQGFPFAPEQTFLVVIGRVQ